MSIETVVVDQFIYDRLSADATLLAALADGANSLTAETIPQGADYPLALWTLMSALDDEYVNSDRVWTNVLVTVRGVAKQTSFGGALATIAQRIDADLHKTSGTTTDGRVFACVRVRPFRMVERLEDKTEVRHLGGVYRFFAKET